MDKKQQNDFVSFTPFLNKNSKLLLNQKLNIRKQTKYKFLIHLCNEIDIDDFNI